MTDRQSEMLNELGFRPVWQRLGVLTPTELQQLLEQYQQSSDKNPEHYRWRAFRVFLDNPKFCPVSALTIAESERDLALQSAMAHELLHSCRVTPEIMKWATTLKSASIHRKLQKLKEGEPT